MKKITLSLIILCSVISHSSKSQIWSYLAQINATIATIPYVFEGTVLSVEIYAGDDTGNKLPWSAVTWNGNIGYFYDAVGNEAHGYSLAKIKVCKIYKGDLNPEQEIEVLTRSFSLSNVYALITGTGADADTSIRYLNVPTSHDPNGEFHVILPWSSYKKKLYFADRINPIIPANYAGKHFYSNFHRLYEMPFYETVDVLNPSGYWERKTAYCALVPYVFDDAAQLQLFLNQINTINPTPTDFCRGDGTKEMVSINEVGTNHSNISVYPNPSKTADCVKIKFDLVDEVEVSFVLTDITGKQILHTSLGTQKKVDYDLKTSVESGIYFLQVNIGQNKQSFRITKN